MKDVTDEKRGKAVAGNLIDRAVAYIDPVSGARRMEARMRMSLAGGYKSGNRNRPALKNKGLSDGSADAEILPSLDKMRSDSRDCVRNEPIARGAINTVVTNVIGTGLMPQSRPDRDILRSRAGLSDDQITVIEDSFEREFRMWANNTACDASRSQTFVGLQGLAFRSTLESGDVFALRRFITRSGVRYSTAIQLIEADRIVNPLGKSDDAYTCAGVKRDGYGAPLGYYVSKSHPGNRLLTRGRYETEFFAARQDDGQWQILHLMNKERPEQTRGVPYLAPIVELLIQLARYTEAEIHAAVISSFFTVFVKTEDGDGFAPLNSQNAYGSNSSDDDVELGAGAIIDLAKGEDITTANPGRPNVAFDPFVLAVLRQIGVALEIPFELLVKHFTASYSAAQAAMIEAWKFFKARRTWMEHSFAQPCYEAVISEAVARGYVKAPGFFSDPLLREAYLMTQWIGPPRGMIDPLKERRAAEIDEDRGWKTGQEICGEISGGDWDQNFQRREKENQKREASGLKIPGGKDAQDAVFDSLDEEDPDENDRNIK